MSPHLKCLFTGIPCGHKVVPHSDKPITVSVSVIEAVGRGHQDPGGQDGGRAHEVRLARGLSQEERGQPREAALSRSGGPLTVFICPDDATSPGLLMRLVVVVSQSTLTLVVGDDQVRGAGSPSRGGRGRSCCGRGNRSPICVTVEEIVVK